MPVMGPDLDATVPRTWARTVDEARSLRCAAVSASRSTTPESLTPLGALAAWTERVRLMTTVIVPQLHDPVGEIRRKHGLHYRLVTLVEKIAARGSKPRIILRIAVPT